MGGNVGRNLEVANLAVTERRKQLTVRCSQPLDGMESRIAKLEGRKVCEDESSVSVAVADLTHPSRDSRIVLRLRVNLGSGLCELCGLLFKTLLESFFFSHSLLSGGLSNVFRYFHRTEVGTTHGTSAFTEATE